jgi:hypothetical protein
MEKLGDRVFVENTRNGIKVPKKFDRPLGTFDVLSHESRSHSE